MEIEFKKEAVFTKSIQVDDIGNCSLRCFSDDFCDYYFLTRTIMGKTAILKFGPICPDIDVPLDEFITEYKKIDFKESKILKELDSLINNPKKKISEIENIEERSALENIPDFIPVFIEGEF